MFCHCVCLPGFEVLSVCVLLGFEVLLLCVFGFGKIGVAASEELYTVAGPPFTTETVTEYGRILVRLR